VSQIWCRMVRTTLAARVLDTGAVPGPLTGHVHGCLRCQAAVVQARRLRRTLASMPPAIEVESVSGPSRGWIAAAMASAAAVVFVAARLRAQRT
jgi:hypothetical protein